MTKLASSRIAIFGIGGVGGHTAEALARCGIGEFDLIDNDDVSLTNVNRQIIATMDTVGRDKVDVMRERILSINREAVIHTHKCFYLPETKDEFHFADYDYVVDAIDTVTGKIALVMQAQEAGTPIISSMGMGNKLNPTEIEVADIYQTSICPLARVMRRELKARGVKKLKVVFTKEKPITPIQKTAEEVKDAEGVTKRSVPGSTSFVPSVAGLIMASEIVKDIVQI